MTGFLLDTNVLSELRRPNPAPQVMAFIARQPLDLLYTSTVVMAEIRFGIEMAPDPAKRAALTDWLTHRVRPQFADRILAVSEDVMFRWRVLVEGGRRQCHTFSQPDLIIAATALHHGLSIVTRNVADYAKAQVAVVNPWLENA